MGEEAQVLPGPLPVTPGLQQQRRTARAAGWPRWTRLWELMALFPSQSSPTCVTPGMLGTAPGAVAGAQCHQPHRGCELSSAASPSLGREPGTGRAPRQESLASACWLFSAAFWDPSPPSQGSRTSGSVCRATSGEPAATGWTVFVNLLETSQYSPELHLLHALKLTVQATRMTLTDLAQDHVF